jgi:hypothetical protein
LRQLSGIGQRLLAALDPDNRFMGGANPREARAS